MSARSYTYTVKKNRPPPHLGMLFCCGHTRAAFVCHQTVTEYESMRIFVSKCLACLCMMHVCVCVCMCLCVSWYLRPVYELLSHCAGSDPTDLHRRRTGQKVSLLSLFTLLRCCWSRQTGVEMEGGTVEERGGRWREANMVVVVVEPGTQLTSLQSAWWAYVWCIVLILQYGRKATQRQRLKACIKLFALSCPRK